MSLVTPSGLPVSSSLPGLRPRRPRRRPQAHVRCLRQTSGPGALAQLSSAREGLEAPQTAIVGACPSQATCGNGARNRLGKSRPGSGGVIVTTACSCCLADDMPRSRSLSNRLFSEHGKNRCTSEHLHPTRPRPHRSTSPPISVSHCNQTVHKISRSFPYHLDHLSRSPCRTARHLSSPWLSQCLFLPVRLASPPHNCCPANELLAVIHHLILS